jgi:hypothetical protein
MLEKPLVLEVDRRTHRVAKNPCQFTVTIG